METQTLPLPATKDIDTNYPTGSQREELERHGVEFDENGRPLWYTVDEWIDKLDREFADHYGEEYRVLANKRRAQWNRYSTHHFEKL